MFEGFSATCDLNCSTEQSDHNSIQGKTRCKSLISCTRNKIEQQQQNLIAKKNSCSLKIDENRCKLQNTHKNYSLLWVSIVHTR